MSMDVIVVFSGLRCRWLCVSREAQCLSLIASSPPPSAPCAPSWGRYPWRRRDPDTGGGCPPSSSWGRPWWLSSPRPSGTSWPPSGNAPWCTRRTPPAPSSPRRCASADSLAPHRNPAEQKNREGKIELTGVWWLIINIEVWLWLWTLLYTSHEYLRK